MTINPLAPYMNYVRLGISVLIVGAALAAAYQAHTWHRDALQLAAVRQELADVKAAQERSQKASQGLQDELQSLRTARKPAPDVRLHRCPNTVPQAGSGRDGATPGAGSVPQVDGRDSRNVGPDLYGLADAADELAARLRACQALLKP